MEELIKMIDAAIAANQKIAPRTPFLEVALGALHTAKANCVAEGLLSKARAVASGKNN